MDTILPVPRDGFKMTWPDAYAKVRSLGVQVQVPTRIRTALIFASLNQKDAAAALDDLRAALHLAGDEHPPAP